MPAERGKNVRNSFLNVDQQSGQARIFVKSTCIWFLTCRRCWAMEEKGQVIQGGDDLNIIVEYRKRSHEGSRRNGR